MFNPEFNNVWRSSHISRNLKNRTFKADCLSVLLYGCETWKVTKAIESKIQVLVNNCLRRILNVISNDNLYKIANIEDMIKRRKWNWIGHTLRHSEGCARVESTGKQEDRTSKHYMEKDSR